MIRRVINRLRRQEPSQPVLFTLDGAPQVSGETVAALCDSPRRGHTRRTIEVARLQNRAANRRARASRKRNRP